MFRLQSLGIVLLAVIDLHYYCFTDTTLETILEFVELHSKYCTNSQQCSTFTLNGEICCQSCSCNKECERDDTCCQERLWQKIIDNTSSLKDSSFMKNGQQFYDTAISGIVKDVQHFEYDNMYSCVDHRLRTRDIYFDIPKIKKAYEMIAKCPNSYSAHTSIKHLCEVSVHGYRKSMVDFNSSNLEEPVSVFIPVTSLKTNITYRNIFCLGCSGETISDIEYISWQAFVTCGNSFNSASTFPEGNLYEIFDFIYKYDGGYIDCNIIMKPPKLIEHLTPKKCSLSDVNTCPLGTDTRLDLFCRSFNLPVKQDKDKSEFTIYRNIACYLCNQNKSFVKTCTYTNRQLLDIEDFYEIGLNFRTTVGLLSAYLSPNTSNVDTKKNEDSSENIDQNPSNSSNRHGNSTTGQEVVTISKLEHMKKLLSSFCNNTESKTCGNIMCPLYFYQSHGECIPTFTSFGGIYFSICLEIKPAQSQQLKIVLPGLTQNLDSIAGSFFSNYSLGIWSSVEEEAVKIIVAIINFITTDQDFISVMNKVDFFLQNMTDIRFQTEQGMVGIDFKLTRKSDYTFIEENNTTSGFYIILLEAYKRETKYALKEMEIMHKMGCYRIVVESENDDELPTTKSYVYEFSGHRFAYSRYFDDIYCLADAIPIDFNTTDSYMFKGFAGKKLNPIDIAKKPEPIFTKNNERKNDTLQHDGDTALTSVFGVRESSFTVVTVVPLAVILLTYECFSVY